MPPVLAARSIVYYPAAFHFVVGRAPRPQFTPCDVSFWDSAPRFLVDRNPRRPIAWYQTHDSRQNDPFDSSVA